MHQQERLEEAQEQEQQIQEQLREQTSAHKVTDDLIVVAIREIVVTRPDISSSRVRMILEQVNKFNVSIKRVNDVRLRFQL